MFPGMPLPCVDIVPSAPQQDAEPQSNESIRRYFERLTLLETIYDKLNMEATKSTPESIDQPHRFSPYDYSTELPAQKYRMVDSRRETDTIIPIQIKHSPNHTGRFQNEHGTKFVLFFPPRH